MKTLLFDFDGTIADSFELVLEITYELTGLQRQSKEEVARLRHLPLLKAVRELHLPVRHMPQLLLQGRQKMLERIDEVHPFPGIPDVLKKLHDSGYHLLVMSSNGEKNVRTFLRANHLEQYFNGVYGGASLFNKAITLRKVLRRNKLVAAECFYIGDEVRDVVAAKRARVKAVAVTWGYQAPKALVDHEPFAVADQPADLLRIFDSGEV